MAEVIRMPKMSDTMTEGVIVEWHKKVGDKVKPGDVLAEIETDKAVMEFESFQEGTLLYIGAEKGQSVKVNDVIAVMGKEGEDYKAALNQSSTPQKEEKKEKPAEEGNAPKEKAKESSSEKKKTVTEEKAEASTEEKSEAGEKEEEPVDEPEPDEEKSSPEKSKTDSGRIKASPLAKKIASDSKVPIEKIKGSGDEGRIIRRDVEKFLSEKPAAPSQIISEVAGEESYDEIAVSQMRKTIARRLVESKFSAPHFYLTMEINMDRCTDMRSQVNELHPDEKISFNDIIIKAVALSLRQNLKVNSSWLGDKIRYNHHIHIGMAVAVEDGLLVPVIKFADQKSFSQINAEAKMFAAKAKEKKLQPDEMTGNTFTISNLGMMNIDEFTAIINPPDSCILAVGKIKKQPIAVKDQMKVASVLKVTMSCDHRAVDGATGAKFLQTLKSYLENPVSLLI
ncbi:MAG TPA: dihydrolipoamide acetyltransferase family protein [Chitinophagales bacterium]|nr:dihydrolipoamide acetyltransferase family protein [Chitinophagales bacterium]